MNRTLQQYRNRWTPVTLDDVRSEMNRLVEGFFDTEETEGGFFAPRANFAETDKHYEVSVELPGLKPEDVHVEFKDGQLWISGERQAETEEKGKTFHRVERRYGQFRRVIGLGRDIVSEDIEAEYKNGLLTVTVPKAAAVQPKRIDVKA